MRPLPTTVPELTTPLLLVEDDPDTHTWLREGLLASGMAQEVVGCHTVAQALDWLARHETRLVLTDLGLPDGSGLDVIRAAVAHHPGCEVLVLSIFGDEANVIAALDAGASGYLLKDGQADSLHEHLQCLREGGSPLSPSIARTLINRHRQQTRAQPTPPATEMAAPAAPLPEGPRLTERELDVLTGVAKGFTYAEVAQSLGLTTNTVRTHIRSLYEKLSVNSRSEALYEYNRQRQAAGLPPLC